MRNKQKERNEHNEQNVLRREKGWAKPNKAPPTNKKAILKLERRKARKDEEEIYKKIPKSGQYFPFQGCFVFPADTDIYIVQFFGKNEVNLNSLRIETKCHIWHDQSTSNSNVS